MDIQLKPNIPQGNTHADRLAIANRIVHLCRQKHGDAIVTIGIYGSTSTNKDLAYSDLDMTIITTENLSQHETCFTYQDLPIVLDYATREQARAEAASPYEGGCWTTFLALYDPQNFLSELQNIYQNISPEAYADAFRTKMRDDLSTLIGTIRNAISIKDRAHFIWAVIAFTQEIYRALCALNRHYVTGQTRLRSQTKTLPLLPQNYAHLIDIISGTTPASDQDIYNAAEELWQSMKRLATSQNIHWESKTLSI